MSITKEEFRDLNEEELRLRQYKKKKSLLRETIIDFLLKNSDKAFRSLEVAKELKLNLNQVRQILFNLFKKGVVLHKEPFYIIIPEKIHREPAKADFKAITLEESKNINFIYLGDYYTPVENKHYEIYSARGKYWIGNEYNGYAHHFIEINDIMIHLTNSKIKEMAKVQKYFNLNQFVNEFMDDMEIQKVQKYSIFYVLDFLKIVKLCAKKNKIFVKVG